MRTYKYQLNFNSFLKSFGYTLIFILIFYIISFFRDENLVLLFSVVFVFAFPSFFLLFEYLYFSLKLKVELTGNNLKIIQNNEVKNYNYKDIEFVTLYASKSNLKRLPSDEFYFLRVKMKDQSIYIITSLMIDKKINQFRVNKTNDMMIASILWTNADH